MNRSYIKLNPCSAESISNVIKELFPMKYNNYFEPFFGAGGFFFKFLIPIQKKKHLSDINDRLMNVHLLVQNNHQSITTISDKLRQSYDIFNPFSAEQIKLTEFEKTVWYFFLNRTNDDWKELVSHNATLLQNAVLKSDDFYACLNDIQERDLVFLDPPWLVDEGAVEHSYCSDFSFHDLLRLFRFCREVHRKNAYFILISGMCKKYLPGFRTIEHIGMIDIATNIK